jgi:prepilin-type N-terminal cleavage/methylation domain-containing protein
MKQLSTNFCAVRRGTTLIEVMAALVILGTIMASMLIARNRFTQQDAIATQKLRAIRALDMTVAQWMSGPASAIPVHNREPLADVPGCFWQTTLVDQPAASLVKAKVMRVEVLAVNSPTPLVSLELLIPADRSSEANP